MYKLFLRKILFQFSPETIHHLIVLFLKIPFTGKILKLIYNYQHPLLEQKVCGLSFLNPVGLAAGFDKDAEIVSALGDLGFGFIEIGTLTPLGQPGNPRPRIFRLQADQALINRMGFNNQGVDVAVEKLRKRPKNLLIAGNIGKNKNTPNEEALKDYRICFETLYDHVDFFVVNVSSPNTPHLRELQEKEPLLKLLRHLKELSGRLESQKPIFLKIAPDLNDYQLQEIPGIVKSVGLDGVVATNTTISRENLTTPRTVVDEIGEGGLSGKPLRRRSTEIIRFLRRDLGDEVAIIGVGGIHSPEDALEKLEAGANLLEIYTGFIYEGPALIKRINKALVKREKVKRQKAKG